MTNVWAIDYNNGNMEKVWIINYREECVEEAEVKYKDESRSHVKTLSELAQFEMTSIPNESIYPTKEEAEKALFKMILKGTFTE